MPWGPEEFEKVFEAMGHDMAGFTPALDMYQTKDAVVVETPLPGIDPSKVAVTVENDVLTIQGQTQHTSEVDEKNYYRKEVRKGSFFRTVSLPTHVKGDSAQASYQNGVLTITIPKAPTAKPKTIKVKAIGK